jgi:hypothetical protein
MLARTSRGGGDPMLWWEVNGGGLSGVHGVGSPP